MRYAIIDIETTGGQATRDKITEIAIVLHNGNQIVDTFSTLINPERSIPWNISNITGITDEMVADAPKFYEVAKKIIELTEGAIFVAHNVRFDYSFIQEEFRRLGYTFSRRQLCTVRLSQQAFVGLRSYSLGNLITHFGIATKDRHRALADALATTEIFEKILAKNLLNNNNTPQLTIQNMVNLGIKESKLPASLSLDKLHDLPETCGVYYMHNEKGDVVYVGKSINIKKRIFEHFADLTEKAAKLQQSVYGISFEETGSELVALLLESHEIKRLRPAVNKAQRAVHFPYCIISYKDERGYVRFGAVKNVAAVRQKNQIVQEFTKLHDAKGTLRAWAKRLELCEHLTDLTFVWGTEGGERPCFQHQIGVCRGACINKENANDYNVRAELLNARAVNHFEEDFFLLEQGKNLDEYAVILVQNSDYQGFGYIDKTENLTIEDLLECIKKYPNYSESNKIIHQYTQREDRRSSLKMVKL